jgi:TonB family protein
MRFIHPLIILPLIVAFPVAAQEQACDTAAAPHLAAMMPPTETIEEFQARLAAESVPVGTRTLVIRGPMVPMNQAEIDRGLYDLLDRELGRIVVDGRSTFVLRLGPDGVPDPSLRPATGDEALDEGLHRVWSGARFGPIQVPGGCPIPILIHVPVVPEADSLVERLEERHPLALRFPNRLMEIELESALDRAGLVEELRTLPESDRTWIFRIRFARNGMPEPVTGHLLGDTTLRAPELAPVVERHLLRINLAHAPNQFVLVVRTGRRAVARAIEETRPSLANRQVVRRALEAEIERIQRGHVLVPDNYTTVVSVLVLANGSVGTVEVTRAGIAAIDESALRVTRLMRFNPARLEGRAVPVKVTIPITYQVGSQIDVSRSLTGRGSPTYPWPQ